MGLGGAGFSPFFPGEGEGEGVGEGEGLGSGAGAPSSGVRLAPSLVTSVTVRVGFAKP